MTCTIVPCSHFTIVVTRSHKIPIYGAGDHNSGNGTHCPSPPTFHLRPALEASVSNPCICKISLGFRVQPARCESNNPWGAIHGQSARARPRVFCHGYCCAVQQQTLPDTTLRTFCFLPKHQGPDTRALRSLPASTYFIHAALPPALLRVLRDEQGASMTSAAGEEQSEEWSDYFIH